MKKIMIVLSLLVSNVGFAQTSIPSYIPDGWRIPQATDFEKDSGWELFKKISDAQLFFVRGDFNGDGIDDDARTLIKTDHSAWGIFIFMNDGSGKYTPYYIGGGEKNIGAAGMLYRGPVSNTIIAKLGKGEKLCLTAGDRKNSVLTKYDCLVFSIYRLSPGTVYYFDKEKNTFTAYFSCD